MNSQIFQARRETLAKQMTRNSLAIVAAAPITYRSSDTEYPYRQNSNMLYLTGFPEPEAIAIIRKQDDVDFILFNRTRDDSQEVWTGPRAGQDGACEMYGANEAHAIADLDKNMPALLENIDTIYYEMGTNPQLDKHIFKWLNTQRHQARQGKPAPNTLIDLASLVHEQRLIKTTDEIEQLTQASEITARAHAHAMQQCNPGQYEYQLADSLFHHMQQTANCPWAYPPIVGSGANSCVLHYNANNCQMQTGDIVLVDAGGEYDNYASDLTRTFPVNGQFSAEQKALYNIVLEAQSAAIKLARPGTRWNQLQTAILTVMVDGLVDLKLLSGSVDSLIEQQAYKPFYMHSSGHWIGLDVHDVGSYRQGEHWRELEPNMVLTIEPGIYTRQNTAIDEKWWNIGIRIEDDVLVTNQEPNVLTELAPKTIADIEALMQE